MSTFFFSRSFFLRWWQAVVDSCATSVELVVKTKRPCLSILVTCWKTAALVWVRHVSVTAKSKSRRNCDITRLVSNLYSNLKHVMEPLGSLNHFVVSPLTPIFFSIFLSSLCVWELYQKQNSLNLVLNTLKNLGFSPYSLTFFSIPNSCDWKSKIKLTLYGACLFHLVSFPFPLKFRPLMGISYFSFGALDVCF